MPWGKTSMCGVLLDGMALDLESLHEFYELNLEHEGEMQGRLEAEWDRRVSGYDEDEIHWLEDEFADKNYSLDGIRRRIGYSMVFLLCSQAEGWLDNILRQLRRCDPPVGNAYKRYRRKSQLSWLECYASFHRIHFATNLMGSPAINIQLRDVAFARNAFPGDLTVVDSPFIRDLIWARNTIVHDRGKATRDEATVDGTLRDVPLRSIEGYADEPPSKYQIEVDRPYIERAGPQLFAFFHRGIEDIKSRYE